MSTPPLRVLVVDDNRDGADTTALLFQTVGFEAVACYDGPSALAAAAGFRPGACVVDLNMAGMDGDELAPLLRGQAGGPVVLVALTAMSDDDSRRRTAAAGFDRHLVKPAHPRDLIAVVDALWRAYEPAGRPADG